MKTLPPRNQGWEAPENEYRRIQITSAEYWSDGVDIETDMQNDGWSVVHSTEYIRGETIWTGEQVGEETFVLVFLRKRETADV